ncbi:hypothetical protein [Nocardioides sp.]|uniref:hypothetical protein n=1 Tax=Nocardioides sp. TaxID=35761 RepID=UPI0035645D0F
MRDRRAGLAALVLSALLSACGNADGDTGGDTDADPAKTPATTGIPTLTVSPLPEEPPTGRLIAEMRQSSRDAAAGRMEVWIDNDTLESVTPARITYYDDRFRTPLQGERLREIPAQSTRGFQFPLPPRPACGTTNDAPVSLDDPRGSVRVEYAGRTETLLVADETDVAGRYTRARCLELAIAKVARLSWSDEVTPGDPEAVAPGTEAVLTLVVRTSGRPGPELRIDTVSGTPVLSPVGTDAWRPDASITGDAPGTRIRLPLKPTRCDAHAFAESGGATAFKIGLRLDGEPGQITLRMSPAGAANAIAFARASCGMLEAVGSQG